MRVIIYGLGRHLAKNIENIEIDDVIVFCDTDEKRRSRGDYMGIPIISPEQISDIDYDYIVVSSFDFFYEISHKLLFEYCVNLYKIICLDYYLFLNNRAKVYNDNCKYIAKKAYINSQFSGIKPHTMEYYDDDCINCLAGEETLRIMERTKTEHIDTIQNVNGILSYYLRNDALGIFIVSHKKIKEINVDGYHTIYVGELGKNTSNHPSDSTMDNIAHLNPLINECTALYWIWKNDNNYYVGLNHYRRFFASPINREWMIQKWEVFQLLSDNDVIVAERCYFENKNIIDQLKEAVDKDAFESSLKCLLKIFDGMGSADRKVLDNFLAMNYFFPCQLFIMRRDFLDEYCQWLFPILFSMIDGVYIDPQWDDYSKRIIGFWAERLFTVWMMIKKCRIVELPIIFTE